MASETHILAILHWLDTHSDHPLQECQIPLYLLVLQDIPTANLQQAALLHVSRSHFFPHPSELRKAALEIQSASRPVPDEFAAWQEVNEEIERTGYLGTPSFSHELIAKTVATFGWRYLCLSADRMSDRSNFLKAYRSLLDRHVQQSAWPEAVRHFIASGESTFAIPAVSKQALLLQETAAMEKNQQKKQK
jgi:hypothetical protein